MSIKGKSGKNVKKWKKWKTLGAIAEYSIISCPGSSFFHKPEITESSFKGIIEPLFKVKIALSVQENFDL